MQPGSGAQNEGDPGARSRRSRSAAGATSRPRDPPSDQCVALASSRSPTSPVGAEALAGDARWRPLCRSARATSRWFLGFPPPPGGPLSLVGSRLPFERTVDHLVLPHRWCRCAPGGSPSAEASGHPPVPPPLRSAAVRRLWTPAEQASRGLREIHRVVHQPFSFSPEFAALSTRMATAVPTGTPQATNDKGRRPIGPPAPWSRVRSRGLEPPRDYSHSDLNAARLPVPPRPLVELASVPAGLEAGRTSAAPLTCRR